MFERPRRAERVERVDRVERADRIERVERVERTDAMPVEVRGSEPPSRAERREGIGDSVRDWRWRERNAERRGTAGDLPPPAPSPVIGEVLSGPRIVTPPVTSAPSAQGDRRMGEVLRNRIATEGWRREWRRDRRYDWRRHRDREWNRYHVGIYLDPFGWNYRRWNVGWRLPSRHYASRYWISDPWYYRLPPVYRPYRWVRYWDDALLVDLRTGRVVDVIHNFFW
jgi:Ni/Co efflux regulator RcnB